VVPVVLALAATGPAACGGGKPVMAVTYRVQNDVDTGIKGNTWAFDDYLRSVRVWRRAHGRYCSLSTYDGQFTSIEGPSPGGKAQLPAGIRGTFTGSPLRTPRRTPAGLPRRQGLRLHERRRQRTVQRHLGLARRLLHRCRGVPLHPLRVPLPRNGERRRHLRLRARRRQDPLQRRHQAREGQAPVEPTAARLAAPLTDGSRVTRLATPVGAAETRPERNLGGV